MFKNKIQISTSIIVFQIIFCASISIYAQTDKPAESQCNRTSSTKNFGTLAVPNEEDIKAAIKRSKSIQTAREKRVAKFENDYKQWIKISPDAMTEEKEKWRKDIEEEVSSILFPQRDKVRLAKSFFDWRENGLDVGKVFHQGNLCNTCWAFASIDAAATSLKKQYYDSISEEYKTTKPDEPGFIVNLSTPPLFDFPGDPRPFVQDLINCMPLNDEEVCNVGWHGKAFNFMAENGIPTSYNGLFKDNKTGITHGFTREYNKGKKFACNPTYGYYGVISWDYVNSIPDEFPTVQQLKEALIEHGPIAVPITYDQCLLEYKGGVFDKKSFGDPNHIMLLIGWDDEREAWLVKNSFGEEWGEKGFAWIKYGSNNIGRFAAWIDADFETFTKSPANPVGSDHKPIKSCFIDLNESEVKNEIYAKIREKYQADNITIVIYEYESAIIINGEVKTEKVRKGIYKIANKFQKKNKCIDKVTNLMTISKTK